MMTKVKIKKNVWLATCAIAIILITAALTAISSTKFPKPTGPYSVGTFQLEWTDLNRNTGHLRGKRKLIVQFYYPAKEAHNETIPYTPDGKRLAQDLKNLYGIPGLLLQKLINAKVPVKSNAVPAQSDDKFPLLIFSHGWDGTRFQNSFLLPELASHGYVIASIEHTNAASGTVFQDGSVGGITPFDSLRFNDSFSNKAIVTWSQDQRFVLDQIKLLVTSDSLSLGKSVDLNKVGVFGHSFGGATAAATLTQDKRFKAGINMDGFYFGEAYKSGFGQPFMEIRADNKTSNEITDKELKEWEFTREQYQWLLYDEWEKRITSYAKNGFESYTIRYSNHMSFSDFTLIMPFSFITAPHRNEHHQLTTQLVLGFFNKHLKGGSLGESMDNDLRYYIKN